jgi:ABC-type phosphate transport system auxiliary subunit
MRARSIDGLLLAARSTSTKLITNIMTQAREPDDIDRVNRELRGVNRRLDRLEYTQISPQEFSSVLDRIYEEIGATRSEMRAEFTAVNARLESLDAKIDIIIRRLSGEGNLE